LTISKGVRGKEPCKGINDVLTLHLTQYIKAHSTQGVKANVQVKSSIPIRAKVEISPKGFTLGVKAKI
jgi:hypothetical protein